MFSFTLEIKKCIRKIGVCRYNGYLIEGPPLTLHIAVMFQGVSENVLNWAAMIAEREKLQSLGQLQSDRCSFSSRECKHN